MVQGYLDAKARLFTPEHARRGVVCVDDEWGARSETHENREDDIKRLFSPFGHAAVIRHQQASSLIPM